VRRRESEAALSEAEFHTRGYRALERGRDSPEGVLVMDRYDEPERGE
jgi:hypothetical protein